MPGHCGPSISAMQLISPAQGHLPTNAHVILQSVHSLLLLITPETVCICKYHAIPYSAHVAPTISRFLPNLGCVLLPKFDTIHWLCSLCIINCITVKPPYFAIVCIANFPYSQHPYVPLISKGVSEIFHRSALYRVQTANSGLKSTILDVLSLFCFMLLK